MSSGLSLKEALAVLLPGLKEPSFDELAQLISNATELEELARSRPVASLVVGSTKVIFPPDYGEKREFVRRDITGCQPLRQLGIEAVPNGRGNTKVRFHSRNGAPFLVALTIADFSGRTCKLKLVDTCVYNNDYEVIGRQKTTLTITALPLPVPELLDRLRQIRNLMNSAREVGPAEGDQTYSVSNLPLLSRRRQRRPYLPKNPKPRSNNEPKRRRWRWYHMAGGIVLFLLLCPLPEMDNHRDEFWKNLTQLSDTLFPYDKEYSTHWPPTDQDIENIVHKTVTFIAYAQAIRTEGMDSLEYIWTTCKIPKLLQWMMTPQGRLYFEFAKKIGDYGGWLISDMSNIPRLYRELMYTAFESMGTICSILDNPTPLVYIGDDIARDAFELYVRLVIHFEYLCHVILLGQAKTDVTFDPGVRVVRQIDTIENWLRRRWKPTTWEAYRRLYRKMKPYTGTQPMIEHFPQQMVLFIPFLTVKRSERISVNGSNGS